MPAGSYHLALKTRGPQAHVAFLIDHTARNPCRERSLKNVKGYFDTAGAHLLCYPHVVADGIGGTFRT